jgi:hypothetical protein
MRYRPVVFALAAFIGAEAQLLPPSRRGSGLPRWADLRMVQARPGRSVGVGRGQGRQQRQQALRPCSERHHLCKARARIYGRAFLNEEGLSVEDRVRVSNERWRAASPGASSERVADVARLNGSGSFQVYRYRNPARPQQPAEYTAFGEDRDEQGRRYGVLIVLTATSEASLRGHEKAFQDVLRNF